MSGFIYETIAKRLHHVGNSREVVREHVGDLQKVKMIPNRGAIPRIMSSRGSISRLVGKVLWSYVNRLGLRVGLLCQAMSGDYHRRVIYTYKSVSGMLYITGIGVGIGFEAQVGQIECSR